MAILIERTGDKALHQLTRDDALAFADWWEERVITEGIGAGTANKNITHIGGMIRAVNKRLKLGLDDVFAGTRIEGGRDGQRATFSVDFIRHVILAPGKLDELNDEARDVVYVVMETGARPSEVVNLTASRIVLDAEVPYIRIEAEGRVLKTEHSERDIPLVGYAREAMKRHPQGFPRYFDKGSSLSATLMKQLRQEEAAADREAQDLFVPSQLQGSLEGSRGAGGIGRRDDGPSHRQAQIWRRLRARVEAEISDCHRLQHVD
ncbi:hypothetical protein [Bradyrhizobium sp. LB12.1]|uniref:hypothetical protein n=1 Tax=Bradyrhizobium sp. LB12.1 TaxID=3156327 RepID=UPI0033964C20